MTCYATIYEAFKWNIAMGELDSKEALKIAVDGMIRRQVALFDLMRQTDIRAQQLLVTYVGLAGATLFLMLKDYAHFKFSIIQLSGLFIFLALIVVGCFCSYMSCRGGKISLPARAPDFWLWFSTEQNNREAIREFFKEADNSSILNEKIQNSAARWLQWALLSGLVAVALATITVIITAVQTWLLLDDVFIAVPLY